MLEGNINRNFPGKLQVRGNRTSIQPPRELQMDSRRGEEPADGLERSDLGHAPFHSFPKRTKKSPATGGTPSLLPLMRCYLPVRNTASSSRLTQDFGEQRQWNRHLGKLKGDVPTVPDHLGADLDQLLP